MKGVAYFRFLKVFLLGILLFSSLADTFATHLRAGNIFATLVGDCSSRTYRIRVQVFTNTNNTSVLFGGDQDYLDFGDGSPRLLIPEIGPGHPNYRVIDASRGIATAFYEVTYTYGGGDSYIISYIEPNRNTGVLNMEKSENTLFYIETRILIDAFLGCSTPPTLEVDPVDRACSGKAWFHNPSANDPDGDSLSYQMVVPFQKSRTEVVNYRAPNDASFYTDPAHGTEDEQFPPEFFIDPKDGTITWDAPGKMGEYNIAFIVIEWKEVRGKKYPVGYVRRDMQIIVEDECNNERPDLEVPDDVCVVAGEKVTASITGTDPDGDQVKIEAVSPIFGYLNNKATLTPPTAFRPSPDVVQFNWTTACEHVQEQPYQVVFKITDKPVGGEIPRVYFKTWRIRVVGPAPEWNDATLNQRTATIKWDPYKCPQADSIQIWRKVDGSDYAPDTCNTGMPESLGYTLIATKDASLTQYEDNNLAPGAVYCYRLVATYTTFNGGESLVSMDTCVGPVLVDVPVITNVSVLKTSPDNGQVKVKWLKPYQANLGQFPMPYTYVVSRGLGYNRGSDAIEVKTVTSSADTVFIIDDAIGLNTKDKVYNYTVMAIAADDDTLGVSFPASTVRLESQSELNTIILNWRAVVPWSNQVAGYKHKIFRGPEGSTEVDLEFLAEIDVTSDGFLYVDEGLEDDKEYCYQVETYGSYGNDDPIFDLNELDSLKNLSQIICVMPGDTILPCPPVLTIEKENCPEYLLINNCGQTSFVNIISWTPTIGGACQADISKYRIYSSAIMGGGYELIAEVDAITNTYEDRGREGLGLLSLAWCYRVTAVDRSGNESEMSNEVCNENCPQYVLPNVFTPNGDKSNEYFSAFSLRGIDCADEGCPAYLIEACARFVLSVEFKVYNRWGQLLYTYEGKKGSENTIYIDWDGRDENGKQLESAVYYYVADVTFDTIDPDKRKKTLKGWIHLFK